MVHVFPDKRPDIEKVADDPDDEASEHKYPPPKKNPIFRAKWMQFIDNICDRENFKVGHLNSLEILCDLYAEYEELQSWIRVNGRSYQSVGRNGAIWKFFPEVAALRSVQSQIKDYTKMLDLVLKRDHSTESGTEKDEWK